MEYLKCFISERLLSRMNVLTEYFFLQYSNYKFDQWIKFIFTKLKLQERLIFHNS